MLKNSLVFAAYVTGAVFGSACLSGEPDPTDEIVDNLVAAGYPEQDIQVVGGEVYVGNDAHVTLEMSREMLAADGDPLVDLDTIQYHTRNLMSPAIKTICVNDYMGNATLSAGLDTAISRYNSLGLTFKLKKGYLGCDATISAVFDYGPGGGVSGFPTNGKPYNTIHIQNGTASYGVGPAAHVIEHELGHCIGFRHTDFFNRSISCGGSAVNEGDGGVGAILVPGTPGTAVYNGSVMNSCFNKGSTGVFTTTDTTAMRTLY
jgi:Dual-action HEIGH metallo-peptidase